jgi:anti-anti-sigma regulatory factor
LIHQGHLTGVLYLENNLATSAFTPDRVELLGLLSLQGAIAIENALLYAHVQEMTRDLQHINERLEESNSSLEHNVAQRTAELSRMNEQLQLELVERQRIEEERARLQEEVIRIQAAMLDELSTPVIPLTNRIMVMPLIGSMDTRRAEQILTNLLNGVSEHGAEIVIIDITGVAIVNTSVAVTLINAAQSIRLLGAQAVITGIRPEVAQTLVATGVDLKAIVTAGTLQSGIAYAVRQSGETQLFQSGQNKQNDARKLFPGQG